MKISYLLVIVLTLNLFAAEDGLDFSRAVILSVEKLEPLEKKALSVLQEEIEKRTGISLKVRNKLPEKSLPVIAIGMREEIKSLGTLFVDLISDGHAERKEGFQLVIRSQPRPLIMVAGNDTRGVFYGVGKLLRLMELRSGSITARGSVNMSTAPAYPVRGHQLGYRPKTNAYDAWDVNQYDQYIRELALFGANSIEVMPPRTDDDRQSEHMKVPPMKMMIKQAEICDSYDLDVWIWYPNMGSDYSHPDSIAVELKERDNVFSRLKRVDVVFVPGGDPGDLQPDLLFAWLEKVAAVLHKYHPKAKIWVSPQAFRPVKSWLDAFYSHVNRKYNWFGGVVFGPWVKTPLPEMRRLVDPAIPIRRYPDITHSISSQYPVRNWDLAYAMTLGRECYNPRPLAEKTIHNALDQYANGSLSYSEGINDDINKFIWSAQDWDPNTPAIETLREYGRLFIHPDMADDLAQAVLALEKNWKGPLIDNHDVETTLHQWQAMDKNYPPDITANYRFQMGLLRATYDAYIKARLVNETALEMKARLVLEKAETLGSEQALLEAENFLKQKSTKPVAGEYRDRCWQIADDLFEKIGSQTSVQRHKAQPGRGDFMDYIDRPLNDAVWLLWQMSKIREMGDEGQRLSAIRTMLGRTDPGPGGFYMNLGGDDRPACVDRYPEWNEDPGSLRSPRVSFGVGLKGEEWIHTVEAKGFDGSATPLAWMNQLTTLYETPLSLIFEDLDPSSIYTLKVAYTGRFRARIQLTADDKFPIHDLIKTGTIPVMTFEVPKEATKDSRLKLTWTCGAGERGAQLAEIWLIKK